MKLIEAEAFRAGVQKGLEATKDKKHRIERDSFYYNDIKGKHSGNPGFVIGNGPSLTVEDLDQLKGVTTIASNKIYLAFEKSSWRPSYYTVVDNLVWSEISTQACQLFDNVHLSSSLYSTVHDDTSSIRFFNTLQDACIQQIVSDGRLAFSPNVSLGAYGGRCVTYLNLQLAVHLGLNPIYLLGCDHYYSNQSSSDDPSPVEANSASNHFARDYVKRGDIVNPAPIHLMNKAFKVARDFANDNSIKIRNATRGGHLEVFERVSFDDIIKYLP